MCWVRRKDHSKSGAILQRVRCNIVIYRQCLLYRGELIYQHPVLNGLLLFPLKLKEDEHGSDNAGDEQEWHHYQQPAGEIG
jgi:hypothetical protein